jgi:hypothetical protein
LAGESLALTEWWRALGKASLLLAELKSTLRITTLHRTLIALERGDRRGRCWWRRGSCWDSLKAGELLSRGKLVQWYDGKICLKKLRRTSVRSQSRIVQGIKAPTSHSHLEEIWITRIGEGCRRLWGLCARIGTSGAHVRRKGLSLLLVRHCAVGRERSCAIAIVVGEVRDVVRERRGRQQGDTATN